MQALVNRFWTLSILLISILKYGLHTTDESSRIGRTKTANALLNSLASRVTKHLSISLALRDALATMWFICGLKPKCLLTPYMMQFC